MDLLKALQSQAEQVEVVDLVHEATIVEFSANRFKSSKVEEMGGTAVRAVKDGRLGFAASSDKDALDKLAVNVLELAAYG
ncbi:MAG: TldD/PmbA family protein, partial [Anaerolineales bacterium]|nr:TldD/PmbA family protein [Anaerolineales bacterium]